MRRPIIAANWKMHKTVAEAEAFLAAFVPDVAGVAEVDIVVAPVFTALGAVGAKLTGTNVALAAQDVFYEEQGAYTGEVAPHMLTDVGCAYAIIGHSERRQYFGETDETVNKKIKAALAAGMKAIVCIGESLDERQSGRTNDVLARQLTGGLKEIALANVVIAYEPIWAIGTGVTATPEQAQETHLFIRNHIAGMYGKAEAEAVRIQYGGSVKPDNVDDLMSRPDIDGALVGGASLKPESFARLVKFKRS
jgi:triosephosphate isomerase